MVETIAQTAARWDQSSLGTVGGGLFNEIHQKLRFLERTHYCQYVPTFGAEYPDYETRLEEWLANVPRESDRQTLFKFASLIIFFTREDFTELYRTALDGPITRWIVDELGLDLCDPELDRTLQDEIHHHTWFCPFSDSMPIADFHHVNHIGGVNFRPDWRSLAAFGDRQRILDFMANRSPHPLRRIVILEDFIGAGGQMLEDIREERTGTAVQKTNAIAFAGSLPSIPVLLVPLVICPQGAQKARELANRHGNVQCEPVIEIDTDVLINPASRPTSNSLEEKVRRLVGECYSDVEGDQSAWPRPYGPFGFGDTGARIVMYSNTPANTLPIIQHKSNTWNPLFPRSARIQ